MVTILLLFLTTSIGYVTLSTFPALEDKILNSDIPVYEGEIPQWRYSIDLFMNNIQICLFAFLGGFILGIGPLMILIANGFMFGALLKILAEHGPVFLASLIPHLSFEIPAFIISTALGLMAGQIAWDAVLKRPSKGILAKELIKTFLCYPSLLLLIAAVIEGYFSVPILSYLT